MVLYGGLDLHGDNVYCTLIDQTYRPVFEQRLPNDLTTVLAALAPYRERLAGLTVESTFNWYWLVDGLQANQYPTRLANPARMQENIGLKSANDKTDARFLAKQMAMGVLPEGYIYPKEERPMRDLLRRRMRLVQQRTGEWLSLEGLVARHSGQDLGPQTLAKLSTAELDALLGHDPLVMEAAQINLEHTRRSVAYYRTKEGKRKKSMDNQKRKRRQSGAAGPNRPDREGMAAEARRYDEAMVEHVRMVTGLIEGRKVSRQEVLEMLAREEKRQHSIGGSEKTGYGARDLNEDSS